MFVATMRQKEGELRALENLEPQHISDDAFLPNVIVNNATPEALKKLMSKYHDKMILDTRDLESEELSELEDLLRQEEYSNLQINYSVLDIYNDFPEEKFEYVKIPRKAMNGFFINWLENNCKKFPPNVMLDFEEVTGVLDTETLNTAVRIISILGDRCISICSGAVPSSLPVPSTQNYTLERFEKNIHAQLEKATKSSLIMSDYCTVSPLLVTGGRAVVQIKYTLKNEYWFVRNGMRVGDYDFVSVCREVMGAETFQADSCWADRYIEQVVSEGANKGNPSVWASIGINKHLNVCIEENL